jgi:hypothetical protein
MQQSLSLVQIRPNKNKQHPCKLILPTSTINSVQHDVKYMYHSCFHQLTLEDRALNFVTKNRRLFYQTILVCNFSDTKLITRTSSMQIKISKVKNPSTSQQI